MNKKLYLYTGIAIGSGLLITWIDTRPNWDDTGVIVFMVLLTSSIIGWLTGKKPWLIALAVGIWIPLYGIFISGNFGMLIALIPAFIGAFIGFFLRKTRD